jgi:hypothetical protein
MCVRHFSSFAAATRPRHPASLVAVFVVRPTRSEQRK